MPRRIAIALAPLLLLTACAGQPATAVKSASKAKSLAGLPSAPVRMLGAPTDSLKLEGAIQLDASYAVNRAGGVNGRKIELISEDDGFDAAASKKHAHALLLDKQVFALFLPRGTPNTEAIMTEARPVGAPVVAPSAVRGSG